MSREKDIRKIRKLKLVFSASLDVEAIVVGFREGCPGKPDCSFRGNFGTE
jgi:hypothetical protein